MFMKNAPRTNRVAIRLTDVERGRLVEKAGDRSISEFLRDILRKHLEPTKKRRAR